MPHYLDDVFESNNNHYFRTLLNNVSYSDTTAGSFPGVASQSLQKGDGRIKVSAIDWGGATVQIQSRDIHEPAEVWHDIANGIFTSNDSGRTIAGVSSNDIFKATITSAGALMTGMNAFVEITNPYD